MDTIQWYPGHMVKAKKLVRENLKLVDVVIELVDARIPVSSRNPDINQILGDKPRVMVLNKADLADDTMTARWEKYFTNTGLPVTSVNSHTGQGINRLLDLVRQQAREVIEKHVAKGRQPRAVRSMIVGIPNVGKSSLINKVAGKGTAKTADRPGVTKGKQWIRLNRDLELLDTPGILWPKFTDPEVGFKLAVTGAIKDEVINIEQVVLKLLELLRKIGPEEIMTRYKLTRLPDDNGELLQAIGSKRGCLISGGQVDTLKTASIVMNEFRGGKIGRFTLDIPE
ncbi:MAG: ribosome biogenesis GTPase YlqF [Bacillota bacterium]